MGSLPEFMGFVTWVHRSWLKASCDSTLILVCVCVFVVSLVVVDFFIFYFLLFFVRGVEEEEEGYLNFLVFFCGTRVLKNRIPGKFSLKSSL